MRVSGKRKGTIFFSIGRLASAPTRGVEKEEVEEKEGKEEGERRFERSPCGLSRLKRKNSRRARTVPTLVVCRPAALHANSSPPDSSVPLARERHACVLRSLPRVWSSYGRTRDFSSAVSSRKVSHGLRHIRDCDRYKFANLLLALQTSEAIEAFRREFGEFRRCGRAKVNSLHSWRTKI